MDTQAIAARIKRLRERANDKSLPQDVRNQMLDEANKLEEESAARAGVRLAKGGMAKKKKYNVGGMATKMQQPMGYAKGGMVKANCGASVPASKGKK
jgi:hypothetical protein